MLMMIDPVHYALYIFLLSFRFTLLQYLNIRDIILLCGSIWAQSNSFDWQLHVTFISGCFTLLTDSYYWAFLDFIRGGQNVKIRCISSCNAPKKKAGTDWFLSNWLDFFFWPFKKSTFLICSLTGREVHSQFPNPLSQRVIHIKSYPPNMHRVL